MRVTLRQTLWLGLAVAIVAALVPAGFVLNRTLESRLEEAAIADLARAPMVVKDRNAARGDVLMMHALEVAGADGIPERLSGGDVADALRIVRSGAREGEEAILVDANGLVVSGPELDPSLVSAVRAGDAPVAFALDRGRLMALSVAPVHAGTGWVGAAGVAEEVNQQTAATVAELTDSDVLILAGDSLVASTAEAAVSRRISALSGGLRMDGSVTERAIEGRTFWIAATPLGDVGTVLFAADRAAELSLLPGMRRSAVLTLLVALVLALITSAIVATAVTRPVRGLATAADSLSAGDFHAPLDRSRIEEVDRMARAFERMRSALKSRLQDLSAANEQLADRQRRLQALQSELVRRDRLAAGARLVTELAHEIRNPVANVRNCLEVVRRRLGDDPEGREFADLAIDELLRMHELAEQMLDLNRPLDPGATRADARDVVRQVAALHGAGSEGQVVRVDDDGSGPADVAMPPDALKQVILNLVQNARESAPSGESVDLTLSDRGAMVTVAVRDRGPGIPAEHLDQIFDPFFSTKSEASGVGLGLFIAEGLVTRFGGRLYAENPDDGGARFVIELPRPAQPGDRPDPTDAVASGGELV